MLENDYVRFIALSLFLLHAKFCEYWCRHDKITASDNVERFLRHSVYRPTRFYRACGSNRRRFRKS